MKTRIVMTLLLAFALSACKSTGADIRTETIVNAKANMKGYKSYAWLPTLAALNDPDGVWAPLGFDGDAEIRWLIDRELRARGFSFAQDVPDAFVSYTIVVDTDRTEEELRAEYGDKADLENLAEGALVVTLTDPKTSKAIWSGAAWAQVKVEREQAKAKQRLAAAVKKIFERFGK